MAQHQRLLDQHGMQYLENVVIGIGIGIAGEGGWSGRFDLEHVQTFRFLAQSSRDLSNNWTDQQVLKKLFGFHQFFQ